MIEILTGTAIQRVAREICKTEDCIIAVSYWSGGAATALGLHGNRGARVVLDVYGGGTSPRDLQLLIKKLGERVKVHCDLHTKVYATKHQALVGSANGTRPGLQLQPSPRVEAVVHLMDQDACAAYELARKIFEEAMPATDEHVRICRERFGRKTLSHSEAGEIERLDFVAALLNQPDIYSHIPVIATNKEVDQRRRDQAWGQHQAEIDPANSSAQFDSDRWDSFEWGLHDKYLDQICLAVHKAEDSSVWAGLVRPTSKIGEGWTFARWVAWSEIPGFNFRGSGARKIRSEVGGEKLSRAIDRLRDDDPEYICGLDLIEALERT
ncbi:phospholipase D family protein [uncultured Paracoccus sp.]|uniref:phospholipase D family protein n=1 Tax=uncultured Paracoccus sp. TaxID=189685 RepID=UPI002610A226|nr:phospholipase D family protein [uncultured Paracoccus sp.]